MSLLTEIREEINELNRNFAALPIWIPISKDLAKQYGWNTVDSMRRWCLQHMPPDRFEKRGKVWHLHKSVVRMVQDRIPLM